MKVIEQKGVLFRDKQSSIMQAKKKKKTFEKVVDILNFLLGFSFDVHYYVKSELFKSRNKTNN